jgi:subtilisin-like proprotein convertase family protein
MKKLLLVLSLLLTAAWARATLTYTTPLPVSITDGSPIGVVSQGTVSGLDTSISSITVGFNITGGFNGNLYAYLVAPNGEVVTLLNHIGTGTFGSLASGFDNGFLLSDTAGSSLSSTAANGTAGQQLTGTFLVGGLTGLYGDNPNGQWTLFFADTVAGGGTSVLNSWTLNITAVPEPVVLALAVFAAMLLALTALKWTWGAKP